MAENKKLTVKQRRFCDEYLANGGNATEAAIAAGYSPKTAYAIGHENLSKLEIQAYLQARGEQNAAKFEYTLREHVKDLDELADLAKRDGNLNAAIRAKELKGKVCGLYLERHELNGSIALSLSWGDDE